MTRRSSDGDAAAPAAEREARPAAWPDAAGRSSTRRLYETAIRMIAARGYEATTLRDIAKRAGVSPACSTATSPASVRSCSRSTTSCRRSTRSARARWPLALAGPIPLRPCRPASTSSAASRHAGGADLRPALANAEGGLFAPRTAPSRGRVEAVFVEAVRGASDAPPDGAAASLGRMLYFAHLAIILWWLLDKSPRQRATRELMVLLSLALPFVGPALWLSLAERSSTPSVACAARRCSAVTPAMPRDQP